MSDDSISYDMTKKTISNDINDEIKSIRRIQRRIRWAHVKKRLDINDPNCWNKWRALYDELTDQEHMEFLNDSESRYPSQKSFTVENFDWLFSEQDPPYPKVLEIGPWKGELALQMMSKYNVGRWHGIDLCQAAIDKTLPMIGYTVINPYQFEWFNKDSLMSDFDICVSAHTIEHLSDEHLLQLLNYLKFIPKIMLEAPINMDENNWDNYVGTHILKMGWNQINEEMKRLGYSVEQLNAHCVYYEKNEE